MLGRMLMQKKLATRHTNGLTNGTSTIKSSKDWKSSFEIIDWVNPNSQNLVAEGELKLIHSPRLRADIIA